MISERKCIYKKSTSAYQKFVNVMSSVNSEKPPCRLSLRAAAISENFWLLRVQQHKDATAAAPVLKAVVENKELVWPLPRSLGEKISCKYYDISETYEKKCLHELITNLNWLWRPYTESKTAATEQSSALPACQLCHAFLPWGKCHYKCSVVSAKEQREQRPYSLWSMVCWGTRILRDAMSLPHAPYHQISDGTFRNAYALQNIYIVTISKA